MTKKIVTKLFLVLLIQTVSAYAGHEELSLHLDCPLVSESCISIEFVSGNQKAISVKKTPEMILSKDNIHEVKEIKSANGREEVQISLKNSARLKLKEITSLNIDRPMVIVSNNKALLAPIIKSKIEGGKLSITMGIGEKNDSYLKHVSWLKKMSEENKMKNHKFQSFSMGSYLIIGLLILFAGIFFAFFKTRTRQ